MIRPLRSHDSPAPVFPEEATGILTVAEAAHELRCSKAHVHNVIHGKVPDLPPLPVLRIGRRVLIRQEALKAWMLSVEGLELRAANDKPPSAEPEEGAVNNSAALSAESSRVLL